MKRFARGLVIGKFCPLHLGHELLIATALARCDEVLLLSYSRPEFAHCEPFERRRWFEARFAGHPALRWRVLDQADGLPHNDDDPEAVHRRFCGDQCVTRFGCVPDAVFTSEAYGDGFAAALSEQFGRPVAHVMVDPARARIPISASRLRTDPFAHRAHVAPEVFASLVPRIGVLGGESSGKTTLARALAARLPRARCAQEYGRDRWVERGGRLDEGDLPPIAGAQVLREEQAARDEGCRLVIGDTTPLTTLFYCLEDFGRAPPGLIELANRHYDLLVLCEPDFDFVQDGTRRDDAFRARQHAWYLERLAPHADRVLRVGGPLEARVQAVARRLEIEASR
ncbi:MAG: ATPase [Panacagrimonas sp.]|nr:AAA family ATPase [Panacagrimonas sp.]MCC2657184.1 ATPase [Panacagrimonas sp.]